MMVKRISFQHWAADINKQRNKPFLFSLAVYVVVSACKYTLAFRNV